VALLEIGFVDYDEPDLRDSQVLQEVMKDPEKYLYLHEKSPFGEVYLFNTIEFMQYILSFGIFDITDLINNSMGIILGMLFYDFLMKRFSSKLKLDKLIFWCGWVGAILLSIILIVVLFKNN